MAEIRDVQTGKGVEWEKSETRDIQTIRLTEWTRTRVECIQVVKLVEWEDGTPPVVYQPPQLMTCM